MRFKELASEIFYAALKAVDPYTATRLYTEKIVSIYQGGNFRRIVAVGFGKAACNMAKALEDSLSDLINKGVIITKYGHCSIPNFRTFRLYEAGHPVPDENGVKGTDEIIKILKGADENTLVVCLISGGGSALLVCPYEDITLTDKQRITELLLKAGTDINELNTVRKHISRVKGGRLAEIAYPAKVISLILSDVIGDRLDVIASGPTVLDESTYKDAINVLEKYMLINKAPESVLKVLYDGLKGEIPETPKNDNKIFDNVENIIVGSNKIALEAAKTKAESLGFEAEIISSEITGEAKEVGRWLADIARSKRSNSSKRLKCLISGGETTVMVKGNGLGGRNMELALSFAMEIEGIDGITLLSAGTDGTDGPTDAAGAIVDGYIVKMARKMGVNPERYLDNNDSYNFFKKIDGLFITGPTGTNVMDIQIMMME